ncbi:MAG: PAS domain S-box protein [Desulfobacteraceae bacterium]|nr:PAS domain S-box protein [Desulfobacteraceae bacterium]
MAIEILNGKKAKDIPVLIKNIDLPAFSYPQLVKQGISEDQLPENSIIHNKPFSFYQKYKVRIYLVGTIISLLLFSILILIFDIIMRKKGEKKLLSLRNYLSNIIDSMPSILIGVDTKGKVTQWNSKAKHITGLPPEDALGQSLDKVIPRLATDMELIHSAMQTCEIKIDRKRVHREKGETLFEDITIYPLIANGIEGAVVRIDDVTEQVCIEEMMVQSEKMLSVGGLAAGMAHEINNPMAGILQTSIVMSNRLTDTEMPANKKVAEEIGIKMDDIKTFMEKRDIPRMVTTIIESGKRVAEIVGNMLSFARKGDSSVSSHNLAELFDKILELAATDYDIKKQYDFKAIEIVKEYEDNLPMVPCGGAKIQQVLLNILRNGAEAMHDVMEKNSEYRPKFTLRLFREIKVNMLCIEIEDNGPGMDEIIRKRIFEPFFTTKAVGVGTGLGLSVSYFIITENHDGEMSVESTPGLGAKFIIRLPLEVRKG